MPASPGAPVSHVADGAHGRGAEGPDPAEGVRCRQGDFEQLADSFLDYLRSVRNLSPNTVRGYGADIRSFLAWVSREGIDPFEVTHRQLRAYLAELTRARYAAKTINRHLSSLRALYGWLLREGHVSRDAAAALASRKAERRLPQTMSDEDLARTIGACSGTSARDVRDRALVELMYASGARISEVSALDVGDVDFASSQVRLFGKGSKERVVPLYPRAVERLEEYLAEGRPRLLAARRVERPTQALFVSTRGRRMSAEALRRAFEGRARAAGVQGHVTPHTVRHTFATELLSGGADLKSVQELLGHESLATTQIYTHVSVDRLKRAAEQAHPRGRETPAKGGESS